MVILELIGMTVGLLFIVKLARDVTWGWRSLLLANWFNFTFGTNQGSLGSFHLDLIDLVSIALFLAGLVRLAYRWREGSTSQTLVVLYAALFLLSFFRGVQAYGINTAGNETRGLIATMIGMTYFFTVPRDRVFLAKFLRYYVYYAAALFVVGVLAYAGLHVGGLAWTHGDASGIEDRLLPSPAASAIASSFIILSAWTTHKPSSSARWMRWMAPLFLAMAVLLRTRTVWMMLIAMAAAMPLVDWKVLRRLIPIATAGLLATLALGAAFYANHGGVSQELEKSAQDSGTWEWRVEGWKRLLLENENMPTTLLIGKSIGAGFWRYESNTGSFVNLPPHSEYITQYLRTGIPGLLAIIFLLGRPIFYFARGTRGCTDTVFPSPSTWCLLCVGAAVFGITYSLSADAWALVGVANALLVERKGASVRQPEMHRQRGLLEEVG